MVRVELQEIRFSRGELVVLDIPNLELEVGSQAVLTGPSGLGKSTLIHLLAGFLRPDHGRYLLDGVAVERSSEEEWDRLRREKIGVVFQHFPMLRGFSLLDNVLIPMGLRGEVRREEALDLLAQVGLSDRLHHLPSQLSAGQRQRAGIVRAVVNRPGLVLADEPAAHLDPEAGGAAVELLRRLCRERGATLLMVSHDPSHRDHFSQHFDLRDLNQKGRDRSA